MNYANVISNICTFIYNLAYQTFYTKYIIMDGWEKQIEQKVVQLPYGVYKDIKWNPIRNNDFLDGIFRKYLVHEGSAKWEIV